MSPGEDGGRKMDAEALLRVKLVIFAAGAAFGLVGMATESRLLLSIGTAILFAGVLLRFLPRFRRGRDHHPPAPDDEEPLEDDAANPSEPRDPPLSR